MPDPGHDGRLPLPPSAQNHSCWPYLRPPCAPNACVNVWSASNAFFVALNRKSSWAFVLASKERHKVVESLEPVWAPAAGSKTSPAVPAADRSDAVAQEGSDSRRI